jgi:hypothetical protein
MRACGFGGPAVAHRRRLALDRPGPGAHPDGVNGLFRDGYLQFLKDTINPNVMRALAVRAGGEVMSDDAL